MYLNVISFTNGKVVPFRTKVPYSVDQVAEGWNVVIDEANGQVISFRGVYIVTIASEDEEKIKNRQQRRAAAKSTGKKKPAIQTAVTEK
ncbi:MAG: hypothetical protein ACI4DV_08280 [Lachnospiraceae bacterium]